MIAIHPTHVPRSTRSFTPSAEDMDVLRGPASTPTRRPRPPDTAPSCYRGMHIDKAHADKAVEWLGTRADPGCAATARQADACDRRPRGDTDHARPVLRGVRGRRRVYKHAFTRTVTEMDNVLFTSLTMNVQPLHLDEEFSQGGRSTGSGCSTACSPLALVGGLHVPELTFGTTMGNLGYDSMKFPDPVFHGDTLRGETTILKKRESKSRTDAASSGSSTAATTSTTS